MYVFSSLDALDIEPNLVDKMHVFGLHRRRVRSNAVGLHSGIRAHYLKNELPLRFRHGFPGLTELEGLLLSSHLAGEPGDHRGRLDRVGGLDNGGPDVAGRNNQQRDGLSVTFSDGDGLGEERLFIVAEDLLHRQVGYSAAVASEPRFHDHDIGVMRVSVFQDPPQMVQGVVITHCHQNAAGAHLHGVAADGFLMKELEMLLHLLLHVGEFTLVDLL